MCDVPNDWGACHGICNYAGILVIYWIILTVTYGTILEDTVNVEDPYLVPVNYWYKSVGQ